MENVFFFQIKQISEDAIILNQLKERKIFFSYFQVNQNYYLFAYSQKAIDLSLFSGAVDVVQELDLKKRKIRSIRGFLLYALEIMENGKDYKNLQSNLRPLFWKKVKDVIRQNKKGALQEYLFGPKLELYSIKNFQIQIDSLQKRVIYLEKKVKTGIYSIDQKKPLE